MNKKSKNNFLYGLILVGGKSSRMKTDKASLEIHGKKQSLHCFELLNKFCQQTFLSNRQEQAGLGGQKGLPQIHDEEPFLNIGPLGGILSAMKKYPDAAWLVLACDLPYVDEKTIQYLINYRNPKKMATAFKSVHDGLPEPLCAIYEPNNLKYFKKFVNEGIHCPRKILMQADVELLVPPSVKALENVNNPEEYKEALLHFEKK